MTTASSGGSPTSSALTLDATPALLNPFCTINIKTHVPITLELSPRPNFHRWSNFFKAMVGKFGLLPFLDATVPARPTDPSWAQTGYAINNWLYTFVDESVLALAMIEEDQTSSALYTTISDLFNDNKESRAIHLSNEFHTLVQGDSTITDYCQRM